MPVRIPGRDLSRTTRVNAAVYDHASLQRAAMSYLKAAGMMLVIHLAFAGLGWLIAGKDGALAGTLVALSLHILIFWYAEKIMLKVHNAREVTSDDPSPMIRAFVADCDRLSMRANMPRPRTYIIDAFQPNAFIAGRDKNHASIAVTDGLLKTLTRAEVSAVVAHELAHVKRGDALAMGISSAVAVILTTLLGSLAYPFGQRKRVSRIVAGLVARITRSHQREYAADRQAGEICGAPVNLANALLKLERHASSLLNPLAERSPATAHSFVIDPLHGNRHTASASHPPTERRIARLHRQAAEMEGVE